MNQQYAEAGVKRKDTASTMVLRLLMILGIIIGFVCLLLGQVFMILGFVILFAMFYFFPKLNVEYEYVFVDGQLDFDKISGKSKRKTLLRIDFDQVEIMAPMGSHALDSYTYIKLENRNYSSGSSEAKPFVIIANVENNKLRIFFEPNEKMLNVIKQKSPRKLVVN